jgi:hypothetical protein
MFSAVRLQRCHVNVRTEDVAGNSAEVPLATTLHSSWVNALERGRRRVIEHFLAARCQEGVLAAQLERRCEAVTRGLAGPIAIYRFDCGEQRLLELHR